MPSNMSLPNILPAPVQTFQEPPSYRSNDYTIQAVAKQGPPVYGARKGWIPRCLEDFGDGGAFPEIPVAQYPMNMGRKTPGSGNRSVIPLQMDKDGHIKYDAVVYQGQRKDKVLHTKPQDALPISRNNPELARPDQEQVDKTTEETRLALEKIIQTKISAALPAKAAEKRAPVEYIRYTPALQGEQFNSGCNQRLIHMVEVQKDPMEPPRFTINKKIPRGPPSPPVPVLHSPNRKVTAKEQQDWKIPPSISNWTNPRGFTVPLDKRLAADGRGLQDPLINDNFAKLSQSLYAADRKARQAIEMRYQIEKKYEEKLNAKREKDLERIAKLARDKRVGIRTAPADEQEQEEVMEREEIKYERHKERERQKRLSKVGGDKKGKPDRGKDRDISEKIALGMPAKTAGQESLFDQRLFNQNKGVSSGYEFEDDSYNVYDQPFRQGGSMAEKIYRPRKDLDQDIYGDEDGHRGMGKRFEADKPFSGADTEGARPTGPVQFAKEQDPFDINKFLQRVKRSGVTMDKDSDSKKSRY
ncbi:hypothetical protein LOD99_9711 [Oopsacas minuta]|uniref:SKI-interacting protein SKIP SNW domain-containing protein n=1 Tax=Oopsacas minuta TaxID=111878 RepID=A0AAV7KMM6_9METZ|nr:hypothetical protein LOD99_9711 [Oopsacas minuta]